MTLSDRLKIRLVYSTMGEKRRVTSPFAAACVLVIIVVQYELYELYDSGKVPKLYGTL